MTGRISVRPGKSHIDSVVPAVLDKRYLWLCSGCFLIMLLHTMRGHWIGDFWEHAAVVRELSTHPFRPLHPLLLLDAPHAFYSPYALMAAGLSRLTTLSPVTTLSILGMVNIGIFFWGFWLFTSVLTPKHQDAAAFYGLLLVLTFWWGRVWPFSGFFHIGGLGHVLPYPSTFCGALSFCILGAYGRQRDSERRRSLVWISVLSSVVLLSHPITYIFLVAGLISMPLIRGEVSAKTWMPVSIVIAVSLLVSACWPYFPFFKLAGGESTVFHESNIAMYSTVVSRTWPALIGIPIVVIRAVRQPDDSWRSLFVLLSILVGVYAYGYIGGKYSYGRMISYIAIVLQVVIAKEIVLLEVKLSDWGSRAIACAAVTAMVVCICTYLSFEPLKRSVYRAVRSGVTSHDRYEFLQRFTGQYDVVLSDIRTSWMVPAFGGKIAAALHPQAFVPDYEARRRDLDRLFSPTTSMAERLQLIRHYGGDYILIRKRKDSSWRTLADAFAALASGGIVYENQRFVLFKVDGG